MLDPYSIFLSISDLDHLCWEILLSNNEEDTELDKAYGTIAEKGTTTHQRIRRHLINGKTYRPTMQILSDNIVNLHP